MNKRFYILLCILVGLISCDKNNPEPVQEYDEGEGVFICNEGNFTYGNGSLSFYNTKEKTINNQVFYNANNFPLGDVVQSMSIYDDKGYIVVNNSGKILVININDFSHIATISGFTSPKYIEFIDNNKAYVSDLYSPSITIINPTTNSIIGSIKIGKGTEQMTSVDNYVYVTSWSQNNKVYKINSLTDELIDSITVTKQPNSIVKDKYDRLWALSDGGNSGSTYGQDTAALTCINTNSFTIEKEFKFSSLSTSPSNLCINKTFDTIYFINSNWGGISENNYGVFKMSVDDSGLPDTPIIPEENSLFYGLGVSPYDSKIYISDAIDFSQKGMVYRYTPNGEKIDTFKVDIIPGYFCFK